MQKDAERCAWQPPDKRRSRRTPRASLGPPRGHRPFPGLPASPWEAREKDGNEWLASLFSSVPIFLFSESVCLGDIWGHLEISGDTLPSSRLLRPARPGGFAARYQNRISLWLWACEIGACLLGCLPARGQRERRRRRCRRSLWSAASSRRFDTSRSDDEHGKLSAIAALQYPRGKALLCCYNGVTKTTTATARQKKKRKKQKKQKKKQKKKQHRSAT